MNKAAGTPVGDKTLADQTLSFVMALLEAAAESEHVTVVYSIADTAFGEQADRVRDGVRDHIEEVNGSAAGSTRRSRRPTKTRSDKSSSTDSSRKFQKTPRAKPLTHTSNSMTRKTGSIHRKPPTLVTLMSSLANTLPSLLNRRSHGQDRYDTSIPAHA